MGVALEAFAQLIARDDARIDLARACLMIAQDAYPGLDVERYLGDIERMAIRLRARLPQNAGAEERVVALEQVPVRGRGLLGQHRRLLRSAQQLSERGDRPQDRHPDHPVDPVHGARPAHRPAARGRVVSRAISWCGCKLRGGTLVLDPFCGGAPQSEDELRSRVKRVIPDGVADDLPAAELPLDQFLEPATKRQILSRVLRNLKGIYREIDKPERMLDVLNRMLLVTPDASAELRDRGLIYHRLECYRRGAART